MRLARVRELTIPAGDEDTPPPSIQTGETMLEAVRALIDLGRQQAIKLSL